MKCLICDKALTEKTAHIIKLTDEEKKSITTPLESYTYCKPCWRILSHPIQGPILMKGIVQQRLKMLGVSASEAEAKAEAYHKALVEGILRNRHKS